MGLELDLEQMVGEVVRTLVATETEIQDRSGRWYRLQVRPYRTLDERTDGAVVAFVDIDTLKRNLKEIMRARREADDARNSAEAGNRAKDVFLATLAHELRTPLTTILSFSQMIRLGKLSPEDTKKGILMIEQSALAQSQLINDLMDVSRIILGKLALDVQDVSPLPVLHEAVESVRPLAERKSLKFEETLPDEEFEIRADADRLRQIFLNLLTNAIKFSKPGGVIEVRAEAASGSSGKDIRFVFRDYGKGISKDFLSKIFERFSQADGTSTRLHGGMGLGLAIVRSLCEAQGASVQAYSAGEGQGSTFTVTFPVMNKADDEAAFHHGISTQKVPVFGSEEGKDDSAPDLKGFRILLVDDDPGARDSLEIVLKTFGAVVCAVDSAFAAMAALPVFLPNVLVSDIAMPAEDGYSLIEGIRKLKDARLAQIPALALSAFAGHDDVSHAMASGFQGHLSKPVSSLELARAILKVRSLTTWRA
jgi:signal transduction histidine kinase/ActR/RegA family two-component response regulator